MRCPAALTHISVTAPKIGYHNFYYFSISMTSPVGVAVRLQGNGRYYYYYFYYSHYCCCCCCCCCCCFPTNNRYLGHGRTRSSSALSGHFLRVNNPIATLKLSKCPSPSLAPLLCFCVYYYYYYDFLLWSIIGSTSPVKVQAICCFSPSLLSFSFSPHPPTPVSCVLFLWLLLRLP